MGYWPTPTTPNCSKKFISALTITGAQWSDHITARPITGLSVKTMLDTHVHEVLSVNGDVTFAPDHVLDQEVHDPIHLVHEILRVKGDVNFASDHVLDHEAHVIMHLVHRGNSFNDDVTFVQDQVLNQGVS